METRIVALDTAPLLYGGLNMSPDFQGLGELTVFAETDGSLVMDRARGAEFVLTNKVKLDDATLAALAEAGLRYVGVLATGVNVVDVNAAKRLGIAVTNVKGYARDAVAQHVWAMILGVTNGVARHASDVAQGGWTDGGCWCRQVTRVTGLAGKTLGILGFGDIGQAVAQIGRAFGMEVLVGQVPGRELRDDRLPLHEMLQRSDIVSLHCPLTTETGGLVGEDFFYTMKPGAVLVNTARGGLINEQELGMALSVGRLSHALLDVLSVEPPPADHPLVRLAQEKPERLTITGHYAWTTPEARMQLIREAAQNIRSFLAGEMRNRIV